MKLTEQQKDIILHSFMIQLPLSKARKVKLAIERNPYFKQMVLEILVSKLNEYNKSKSKKGSENNG